MKTIKASALPKSVAVAVVVDGPLVHDGRVGSLVIGRAYRTKSDTIAIRTAKGTFDLLPGDKIKTDDPAKAVDAQFCDKHDGEVYRTTSTGYECKSCWLDYSRSRRKAIKAGEWEPQGRSDAAKAERLERVMAAAAERELSRERMIGNSIRRASNIDSVMRGSKARRAAYRRAHLTRMVEQYGVTVEQAANWAGIDPWQPMTWAEYRAEFPTKQAADDADAAA